MEEAVMRVRRYKKNLTNLAIHLSMLLIFWGGMLRKSFNADTISHMASQDADIYWNLADGRYIIALGDAILLKMGLRVTTNLSISMLLAFLLFAMAMLTIQNLFKKWQPEDTWAGIGYFCGTNLVFLNVLFSELLMFGECSIYFAFGYLMASLGVWQLTKKRYISMFFLFLIAACTYQYTMIFAAILIAFYICLEHEGKLTLKAAKEELCGIFLCMGTGMMNLFSIRLLEKFGVIERFNKTAGWGNLGQKLADLWRSLFDLHKNSLELLPNMWVPLLFTAGVFLLLIYSCIESGEMKRLPFILIVYIGSVLMLYVIPLMQENFYFPPRMAFVFYLSQGLLLLTSYAVSKVRIQKLLSLVCLGYLMIQLLFSDFVVTNRFVSNTLDTVYAKMMYQEVLKYEEETGIEVTKIVIYKDTDAPDSYEEVKYHSYQINERTLGTATSPLILKVTGRSFEKIEGDEEIYREYFQGKNWDYLDLTQQLVFAGDTVYWCVF